MAFIPTAGYPLEAGSVFITVWDHCIQNKNLLGRFQELQKGRDRSGRRCLPKVQEACPLGLKAHYWRKDPMM